MAAAQAAPVTNIHTISEAAWAEAQELECVLAIDLTLPGFKVADALRLRPQSVINSHWPVRTDVPVRVNGEWVASGEFEVVENHLAVRLTELR